MARTRQFSQWGPFKPVRKWSFQERRELHFRNGGGREFCSQAKSSFYTAEQLRAIEESVSAENVRLLKVYIRRHNLAPASDAHRIAVEFDQMRINVSDAPSSVGNLTEQLAASRITTPLSSAQNIREYISTNQPEGASLPASARRGYTNGFAALVTFSAVHGVALATALLMILTRRMPSRL